MVIWQLLHRRYRVWQNAGAHAHDHEQDDNTWPYCRVCGCCTGGVQHSAAAVQRAADKLNQGTTEGQ